MKPIKLIAVAVSLLALCALASVAQADGQRYERRSREMAIPDPVLDPFHGGRQIVPVPPVSAGRIPDSVDHEALDVGEGMDDVEREAYESYLVEQGLVEDPHDHLRRDAWDGSSGPDAAIDDGGYDDPVQW